MDLKERILAYMRESAYKPLNQEPQRPVRRAEPDASGGGAHLHDGQGLWLHHS